MDRRGIFTAQERMAGYYRALEKAGIPVRESLICHGDYTIQGGVRSLEELVQKKSGYDSGVCDQLRNDNGGHDRSK